MITVFTPAYNRAHLLPRLFESLCKQTNKVFEWLIVDDGSTDNTKELVLSLSEKEGTFFPIRYFYQENGGKHRAINRGIKEAKGELFFIVDSDDILSENAMERINYHYNFIKADDNFCGVCGMRAYPNKQRIATNIPFNILECTAIDFRYKYGIFGDLAEVLKTKVLRNFLFPNIEGEKFCPEALIWFRIAKAGYKYRFFNDNIYICEYLEGGLTSKILKIRIESPSYAMLTYDEIYDSNVTLKRKIEVAILFWRFYFHCPGNRRFKKKVPYFFLPLGYLFFLKDRKKYEN